MRRVIFSRKGFDSGYGGMSSVFVEGGEMVSFPIPHDNGKYADPDLVGYDGVCAEGMSLRERIGMLKSEAFAAKFDRCHHDPDLRRGVFGQSGPQQGHLCNEGVDKGDLFLFFGLFQQAEWKGGALRFCSPRQKVHALFGYMQVKEKLPAHEAAREHPRLRDHPHLTPSRLEWDKTDMAKKKGRSNNTVYLATENLSLPGAEGLPGYGVFRHSSDHARKFILTADGHSCSFWDLPRFFDNQLRDRYIIRVEECRCKKKRCPTPECRYKGLCTTSSASPWQESVVNASPEVLEWALERIRIGMRAD